MNRKKAEEVLYGNEIDKYLYKKEIKRLSVEIPKSLYLEIKMLTGIKNCTITKWLIRTLYKELKSELSKQ